MLDAIFDSAEHISTAVADATWSVYMPTLVVLAVFISYRTIIVIKPQLKFTSKIRLKNILGPVAISLGAMIGTGAIIAVLGSLDKLATSGQIYFEAMAAWAVINSFILLPLTYSETMIAKITNSPPQVYLAKLVHPKAAKTYAISFIVLYVLGFGGFQFNGVDTAFNIITSRFLKLSFDQTERYFLVILPIVVFCVGIVLTKLHHIFIRTLAYMIGLAVILYFTFFTIFVIKTAHYIPTFVTRAVLGLTSPVSLWLWVPSAMIFSAQRIMSGAECGLGAKGMAALEANSKPDEAATISLLPTIITMFVGLIITVYIASYGQSVGIVQLGTHQNPVERLTTFYSTAVSITGNFGLTVILFFTLLCGVTTLLGSYYFVATLTDLVINKQIGIYFVLIMGASTLSTFGLTIIFDIVDLLMFVCTGINVLGLTIFAYKKYRQFI